MGLWQRNLTTGNHFTAAAGVKIAPILGIDLSMDSNYASTHILKYRLAANGKVCGDNNVPAYASNVNTGR